MQIYRFEHRETKVGVYRLTLPKGLGADDTQEYLQESGLVHDWRHAMPREDSKLAKHPSFTDYDFSFSDWIFGFQSIEQLRTWFYADSAIRAMEKLDVVLRVYEAPQEDVMEGHTQVMFRIEHHGEPVKTIEIGEFLNGVK